MTESPATSAASPTAAAGPEASGQRRGRQTVGDMVRSLALVLAVVAVVVFVTLRDQPEQRVREIGYAAQLARTRGVASYDVLAPVGLGSGWKATSARGLTADGAVTWHLGFVTPTGHYAAVEQSDGSAATLVAEHAAGATRATGASIGGKRWQRLAGGDPEGHALVLPAGAGDATTMVGGSATWAELTRLAGSLRGR